MCDSSLGASLRVAFLIRALAPYRVPLYERLARRADWDQRIFCQDIRLHAGQSIDPSSLSPAGLSVNMMRTPQWQNWVCQKTGVPMPLSGVRAALSRFRPDVVVMEGLSNVGNDLACVPFLLARRTPFVWWSLGNIPSQEHTLRARAGVPIQRWFVRHASAMLAYSSYASRYMESLGGRPEDIFVVYNTLDEKKLLVDIDRCRPMVPRLRSDLGLGNRPVIVFSGTINAGKRLDVLLEAFAQVRSSGAPMDPALIVIGDGPCLGACVELARVLGIHTATHFVGRREADASAYFMLGHLCVLPGLGGLAINHAFAHGLPVICGRADGCEEDLVYTGETGFRLGAVSVSTLSEAIIRCLGDLGGLRAMGERAFRLVTERITMDHFADTVRASVLHAHGMYIGLVRHRKRV